MTINWDDDSGATGYEAEEDGGDLPGWRGTDKSFERSWTPGASYRWRIRSTGPNDTVSKWSVWAGVTCPVPAPSELEVECRDDGKLAVSWDAVTGASRYIAKIEGTSPAPASTTSTKNQTSTSFETDAKLGWTYAVQVKAQVKNKWSGFSDAESDTCELPPCEHDSGLSLAGLSNHRHGVDDCHIHEVAAPSCSASEDQAYTVHADTAGEDEPDHTDGVVLACHPGRDQGVVSPQPLSVECGTDGIVRARWNGSTGAPSRFEVEGDLSYEGLFPNKTWDGAPLASYTIRARSLWDRAGQDPVIGPWTVRQTATCPRFVPQDVSGQCNQGIVKVLWDKVGAAGKYRINGPTELVGASGYQEVAAHGSDPQATRRSAYWFKNEGDSYTGITIQAHMNGDWSALSNEASVECDPFDPDPPGTSMWESPNAIIYPASPGTPRTVLNPDLFLNSHTCGTRTTTATGSTRTCTATWYEGTPITLTAKHHGSGRTVNHGASEHLHLRRDSDTSPYYASLAPHRHCDTESGLSEPGATCPLDADEHDNPLPDQAPIIKWHPALESAGLTLWERLILDITLGTGIGLATGGAALLLANLARAGITLLSTSTIGAGAGAGLGLMVDSMTRTSAVKVNIMAPNCLPGSDLHDGNTWIRQSRSSQPVPDSPVPDPSTAYVPIRTQTEHDGHITVIDHTVEYCVEVTE